MKKVIAILKNDIRSIFSHVLIFVIFAGVCFLPALYAWCNIYSNWDPYAMNALRECVAGFYGNRYLMNLGILLLFAVLFMLIGVICHVLNRGMHHKIEEVKAKTDLMI